MIFKNFLIYKGGGVRNYLVFTADLRADIFFRFEISKTFFEKKPTKSKFKKIFWASFDCNLHLNFTDVFKAVTKSTWRKLLSKFFERVQVEFQKNQFLLLIMAKTFHLTVGGQIVIGSKMVGDYCWFQFFIPLPMTICPQIVFELSKTKSVVVVVFMVKEFAKKKSLLTNAKLLSL